MPPKQKRSTIVKVLIAIVVIGIIAAMTIVTYSSIQERPQERAYI